MGKIVNNPDFTDSDSNEALDTSDVEQSSIEEDSAEESDETEQEEELDETNSTNENEDEGGEETEEVISAPTSSKVKIGEKEYEPSELAEIVAKGSKLKELETQMPGFNVETLMPEFTRKSQLLAAYEKRNGAPKSQVDIKELEELGVDAAQLKAFEKAAKHLGFVRQTDLVQDSVEVQKDSFIARHPEYAPGSVVSDAKWAKLTEEFNLYDWKNHPDKVEKFLEKAHSDVSKTWEEAERGAKTQAAIVTKKAQVTASATGGGGGKGAPVAQTSNAALADKYRRMGWTEDDIKEILS